MDEPRASGLARVATDPVFPLLGIMLVGGWLAWPWFLINGVAIGSPMRRREQVTVALCLVALVLMTAAYVWAIQQNVIASSAIPYAVLPFTLCKLGVAYRLYALQAPAFELHRYYGGPTTNGLWVLLAGYLVKGQLRPVKVHDLDQLYMVLVLM